MPRITLVVAVALSLLAALAAEKQHEYQPGKLLNVTTDEVVFNGDSHRRAIFIVQIADVVYTSRGGVVRYHAGDIGQGLIIGDSVKAAVVGGELILLKPDGKELKTTIIKRSRPE